MYFSRWTPEDVDGTKDEVIRLFVRGHSYSAIALAVGLSEKRVRSIVREEAQEKYGNRQSLLDQAAHQMDWIARGLAERCESSQFKDSKAVELFLKAVEGKRKLFGLDRPTEVTHTHQLELRSLDEINAELARYGVRSEMPALPPPSEPEPVADAEFEVREPDRSESSSDGQGANPQPD